MTHFEAVEVIASHLTNQIVISNVGDPRTVNCTGLKNTS